MSEKKTPRFNDLVRLEKYEGYYISPKSGKITYRRTHKGQTIRIATGVTGKLNPKTGKVEGIAEARAIVELELEKRRTGKTEVAIKRERQGITNPRVEDIWNELCSIKFEGKEQGTKDNYDKAWRNGLQGFWGEKTCREIRTETIPAYKAWYLKEKPKRLFDKTYDFLKMLIRFMHARGYIPEMPDLTELNDLDEIIKKNKRYKKAGRVYTEAEQKGMLAAWEDFLGGRVEGTSSRQKRVLAARARLSVRLGLLCGLRAMEAMKLKRENIDLQRGVMNVWSLKNHKWREVPLVPEVTDAIKYQLEANAHLKSQWLFPMPSDPDRHLSSQLLEKTWYRVREIAGVIPKHKYDARFHDLRKTFATMTAEQGWPWKVACEILDMTGDVYEKTYANRVSYESKAALMQKHFGGAR